MCSMTKVRVRIAPSPTGNLHVGLARAALFNELFARQHNGIFIVRLEDTDKTRSKKAYEDNILESLKWLGLTWDEGPYRQSERTEKYTQALQQLLDEGKAKQGEGETIVLQVEPQEVTFHDEVRGDVRIHTDSFGGSFIIARSLTDPLFHLAVVVDDATMDITHVIRGEDHLHNTAKHILIQRALGYATPVYAHLPLLLNEKRAKLSKRSGETSLLAYRDLGYLPEAMLNYLALLGWSPKDDQEFFTHAELTKNFSLTRVQKSGAIFSMQKLQAMNKAYIRMLSPKDLLQAAKPFLPKTTKAIKNKPLLEQALALEQARVATLQELPEAISFCLPTWQSDYLATLLIWKKNSAAITAELLAKIEKKLGDVKKTDFGQENLEKILLVWIDAEQLGRGDTLWPMRVALTGREHSPGPFEVASVLGKAETLRRIDIAQMKLKELVY